MFKTTPLVLLLSLSSSIHAKDNQVDLFSLSLAELLEYQVVTAATGFEQSALSAPASVTVIEENEWKARGDLFLSEAIQGVEGVQLTSVNSSSFKHKITIRGLGGDFGQQVKILYDGVPLNGFRIGGFPTIDIPLAPLKRIEIIRNSGSVTYGADAYGGIINLVSKDIKKQNNQLIAQVGQREQKSLSLLGSNNYAGIDIFYSVHVSEQGVDNDSIVHADTQTTFDGLFNTNASRAPGAIDTSQQRLSANLKAKYGNNEFSMFYLAGESGSGAGVAEVLDPGKLGEHRRLLMDYKHHFNSQSNSEQTLQVWLQNDYLHYPLTIFPAGTTLPIGADGNINFTSPVGMVEFTDGYIGHPGSSGTKIHVNYTEFTEIAETHQLRWQVGAEAQMLRPTEKKNFGPGVLTGSETIVDGTLTDVSGTEFAYLPDENRYFSFASVQDIWTVTDSIKVHLGLRYDHYEDFGSTVNPRGGVVWQSTDDLLVKAFFGTAFRAPSFYDLYGDNNPVNLGNVDLNPEKITTSELNLSYNVSDNVFSTLTLYSYQASDLIEYVQDPEISNFVAQNIGKNDGKGLETSIRWRKDDNLDLVANYSYVDSRDADGNQRHDFSKQFASLSANYRFDEALNLNLFVNYSGEQNRRPTDTREPMPASTWLKANVAYQFNTLPMSVNLTVDNLTDEEVYYPSRTLQQGLCGTRKRNNVNC